MRIEDRLNDMITFIEQRTNFAAGIELSEGVYSISFEDWSSCGSDYWSEGEFENLNDLMDHLLSEWMPQVS